MACWFGVHRSTMIRAISEVRPPLAQRGLHRRAGRPAAYSRRGRRVPGRQRSDRETGSSPARPSRTP
ncbi:hypothetical protein ACFXKY_15825 [Streptomyces canus]|uniref:hypothetical protein n=1 Tax=Streptomyces canus TaxID=58343 RepID=UPI0036A27B7E